MNTKFRVNYSGEIKEYKIEKETEKTILYSYESNGKTYTQREHKKSNWSNWFETSDEAIEYLRNKYEKEIKILEDRLYIFKQKLENLK